jgi:hypothetical protein
MLDGISNKPVNTMELGLYSYIAFRNNISSLSKILGMYADVS